MRTNNDTSRLQNIFYSANDESGHGHGHGHEHRHGHGQAHEQHSQSGHEANDSNSGSTYYCPMKCEGEKVYDQPGNCPVCHMKLVPVKK